MRQHIEHLAAALAAVGIALFISYFNTGSVFHNSSHQTKELTPLPSEKTTFGSSTIPAFTLATSSFDNLFPTQPLAPKKPAPKVATTSTPAQKPAPTPVVVVKPEVAPSSPSPATTGELTILSKSIVNIICIAHDGSLRSISGSGVIIDSRGIILTVAHVAQSELLEEYLGDDKELCTIRTGSPAKNAYYARPIYVSEPWVKANPTTLISSQPTGTGEHDYALLAITQSATDKPLPSAFPSVSLSTGQPRVDDSVFIGSYGAQDLSSTQVRSGLYPTLATSTIIDRYTFTTNTVDVLAIGGSAASQEGSSGGAVVNDAGELVGLITTSATKGPYSEREMRVITPAYIRRSYQEDTGKTFTAYFGDTGVPTLVDVYRSTAETLGQFIAHAIGLE